MTERGFNWTRFWMEEARSIEKQIKGKVNPIQDGKELRDRIGAGVTKKYSLWIINGFAVIYSSIFIFNIVAFLFNNSPVCLQSFRF